LVLAHLRVVRSMTEGSESLYWSAQAIQARCASSCKSPEGRKGWKGNEDVH